MIDPCVSSVGLKGYRELDTTNMKPWLLLCHVCLWPKSLMSSAFIHKTTGTFVSLQKGQHSRPTQFLTPSTFHVKAVTYQIPHLPSLIPSPSPFPLPTLSQSQGLLLSLGTCATLSCVRTFAASFLIVAPSPKCPHGRLPRFLSAFLKFP